jgi:hypothetical protein
MRVNRVATLIAMLNHSSSNAGEKEREGTFFICVYGYKSHRELGCVWFISFIGRASTWRGRGRYFSTGQFKFRRLEISVGVEWGGTTSHQATLFDTAHISTCMRKHHAVLLNKCSSIYCRGGSNGQDDNRTSFRLSVVCDLIYSTFMLTWA